MPYNISHTIDLNCDIGEGLANDKSIMPFISSANIACGYHAGDTATIKKTIDLCLRYKIAIGAHPGFADKQNFGRTEIILAEDELYSLFTEQIILMKKMAEEAGAKLHHVKPHGALYNMAAKNTGYAQTLLRATKDIDPLLIFYGLSNSEMPRQAQPLQVKTASEVFADRTYQDDGSLTPRSQAGALITETGAAVQQALQLIVKDSVQSVNGKTIPVKADTICIHGDGPYADIFAKTIFEQLTQKGIRIETL